MKTPILFLLLILQGCSLFAQEIIVQHTTQAPFGFESSKAYMLADSVCLRRDPGADQVIVSKLPIGTAVELLGQTEEMYTIRGISSPWYRLRTGKDSGWAWGGYIASVAFRSNADTEIKFLAGFSHVAVHKNGAFTYRYPVVQIRAVRGNTQIDKLSFEADIEYFEIRNYGSRGLDGIKDVITLTKPCKGGCGCTNGEYYIFWTGQKLYKAKAVLSIADGYFSSGSELIFPADIEGEAGYVKLKTNTIDEQYDYTNEYNVMRRIASVEWLVWDGIALVPAPAKLPERKLYYYNYEEGKVCAKPE